MGRETWRAFTLTFALSGCASSAQARDYDFSDCHVHLTNYSQEGVRVENLLALMGPRVKRAALFGIPLQQLCSDRVSGDNASHKLRLGNYERLFDEARRRVRAWEQKNL
jgi:hypothetical protein